MIAVDSSAVVAMLFSEPQAGALAARLAAAAPGERVISAANYVEAGTVLAGRHAVNPAQGVADLDAFMADAGIAIAPIDAEMARTAMQARIRFGRGFGSGAGLNFADCFAYALAKALDAPLLYVGNDFAATDVVSAL